MAVVITAHPIEIRDDNMIDQVAAHIESFGLVVEDRLHMIYDSYFAFVVRRLGETRRFEVRVQTVNYKAFGKNAVRQSLKAAGLI